VVKSLRNENVEGILTRVSARPMTAVVPQGDRVGQGYVDADPTGDRGRDLGHFESVGQPGALVVAWINDDLRLAGQAPERSGVHNPITVPLEAGALVIGLLRDRPISSSCGKGSAGAERCSFALLPKLTTHDWSCPRTGLWP
jgi:hypothetical protein